MVVFGIVYVLMMYMYRRYGFIIDGNQNIKSVYRIYSLLYFANL